MASFSHDETREPIAASEREQPTRDITFADLCEGALIAVSQIAVAIWRGVCFVFRALGVLLDLAQPFG